jgi:hypothetical protein
VLSRSVLMCRRHLRCLSYKVRVNRVTGSFCERRKKTHGRTILREQVMNSRQSTVMVDKNSESHSTGGGPVDRDGDGLHILRELFQGKSSYFQQLLWRSSCLSKKIVKTPCMILPGKNCNRSSRARSAQVRLRCKGYELRVEELTG